MIICWWAKSTDYFTIIHFIILYTSLVPSVIIVLTVVITIILYSSLFDTFCIEIITPIFVEYIMSPSIPLVLVGDNTIEILFLHEIVVRYKTIGTLSQIKCKFVLLKCIMPLEILSLTLTIATA